MSRTELIARWHTWGSAMRVAKRARREYRKAWQRSDADGRAALKPLQWAEDRLDEARESYCTIAHRGQVAS